MTVETYLADLGTHLQTNSIGTLGTDIFYNGFDKVTNCITLNPYPGSNLNNIVSGERNPHQVNLNVLVRNSNGSTAKSKADSIYALIGDLSNILIGTTRFFYIQAKGPPGLLSRANSGATIYSVNFSLLIQ